MPQHQKITLFNLNENLRLHLKENECILCINIHCYGHNAWM